MTGSLPEPPDIVSDEVVYSNQNHLLNQEIQDLIAHDQGMCAHHDAKNYGGVVFAVTETIPGTDQALPMWYEHVFILRGLVAVYRGWRLEEVIEEVVNDYGYA